MFVSLTDLSRHMLHNAAVFFFVLNSYFGNLVVKTLPSRSINILN